MKHRPTKVTNPKRIELRKWLYGYCHSYSAYITIYPNSRRKPNVWDNTIRVGIDWLRDHAKNDPELMTALVLEEL